MSTTSNSQNYLFYVNLYKTPSFQENFKSSMNNILVIYEDNGDNLFDLYSCIGEFFTPSSTTSTLSSLGQNTAIFYNFWSIQSNIDNVRTLFQSYLIGNSGSNQNNIQNFVDVNNAVTYILSFLFSTSQYNSSGEPTSYGVDLLKPKNIQPAVENIKNFIQSNVSSSQNNLLGAGNYQISNTTINTTNPILLPNQGFISSLCEHVYTLYKRSNNELKGEKLINTYRFFVSQNTPLLSFCGCFVPEPPFFTTKIPSGFGANLGESPCDPLCYNNSAFKLYVNIVTKSNGTQSSEGGGTQKKCNSQVCVIDQTSINSLDSNGNINFNQTCRGCQDQNSSCLCFLDVSPNQLVNKISSGSTGMMTQQNYQQNCPGNSVCFKYIDGVINEVKCNKTNTPMTGSVFDVFTDGVTKITNPEYIPDFFWFLVTIIFVLLLMFMYQVSEN